MVTTIQSLRNAGKEADRLHQQSRDLLVSSVRQAARDGLSQRQIAAAIGRSQPEVSRLLRFSPQSELGHRLSSHRLDILRLARQHGVSSLRVFGSVARGTDTESSDIDLLVDVSSETGMFALARFERDVSSLLEHRVDVVPEQSLKPGVAATVLKEAIPL